MSEQANIVSELERQNKELRDEQMHRIDLLLKASNNMALLEHENRLLRAELEQHETKIAKVEPAFTAQDALKTAEVAVTELLNNIQLESVLNLTPLVQAFLEKRLRDNGFYARLQQLEGHCKEVEDDLQATRSQLELGAQLKMARELEVTRRDLDHARRDLARIKKQLVNVSVDKKELEDLRDMKKGIDIALKAQFAVEEYTLMPSGEIIKHGKKK